MNHLICYNRRNWGGGGVILVHRTYILSAHCESKASSFSPASLTKPNSMFDWTRDKTTEVLVDCTWCAIHISTNPEMWYLGHWARLQKCVLLITVASEMQIINKTSAFLAKRQVHMQFPIIIRKKTTDYLLRLHQLGINCSSPYRKLLHKSVNLQCYTFV